MIGLGVSRTKYVLSLTWDDAPHLSDEDKEKLWATLPPHERDARSKGIPSLGAGAVYPVAEDRITCDPFHIPEYWPVAFAMDVGWNNTAALWGAWDRSADTVYVWSEYKLQQAEPATHVEGIKSRGAWIPGVIDPASRGRSQHDGLRLLDEYSSMGLDIAPADNAVEAGIQACLRRMMGGRLKIFSTCHMFFQEFRVYQRSDKEGSKGKIVKKNDHLMDCMRYLIMSGMDRAVDKEIALDRYEQRKHGAGANAVTGY